MSRTRTRLELQTEIRELTDTVDSTHVTNTTLQNWINEELAALWDDLVLRDPSRYRKSTDISTTAGTKDYTSANGFPADFHSQLGLDFIRGDEVYPVPEYKFGERAFGTIPGLENVGYPSVRYEIFGQGIDGTLTTLRFDRDPGTNTYRLHYVQAAPTLTADGSTFDGVSGWDQVIVRNVCMRVCAKEDTDATIHAVALARADKRVRVASAKRDQQRPGRIQRVRRRRGNFAQGWQ